MPIVPSRSARIQDLLSGLSSASGRERDSSVARLTLIGERAVEPLVAFLPTAAPRARRAALEVLDRLGGGRALAAILAHVQDAEEAVALRALKLAGSHADPRSVPPLAEVLEGAGSPARRREAARSLARLQASGLVAALDPLVGRLVDETEEEPLRLAILDGLAALEPPLATPTLRPLVERLRQSAGPVLAARATSLAGSLDGGLAVRDTVDELLGGLPASPLAPSDADRIGRALWQAAVVPLCRLHEALDAAGEPNSVRVLACALAAAGQEASIPALHRALGRLGSVRPRDKGDEGRLRARSDLHRALAALGSRIALFDLRESIEARPRAVMTALLGVAARVGDASLVPSLARAASEDPALQRPCADAFAAIVRRTRLRRTSTSLRAVRPAHRSALAAFWESARRHKAR
jgi:hypothetical protein